MSKRILITGGATPLGLNIAAALLDEGAELTLLLRPGTEAALGSLAQQVSIVHADLWDSASLRGRGRGHHAIIHTVGSMQADPSQGLSYQRLNTVSARNAAGMCVSDGVPHLIYLSAARAIWLSRGYIAAKREAEAVLRRQGIAASVVRAPLLYVRGTPRPPFYRLMSALGKLPPLSWMGLANSAPMPLEILARAVAQIALGSPPKAIRLYRANELRRLTRQISTQGQP